MQEICNSIADALELFMSFLHQPIDMQQLCNWQSILCREFFIVTRTK